MRNLLTLSLAVALLIAILHPDLVDGQRRGGGRKRGRTKVTSGRGRSGYKSKESKEYYNNPNAAKILDWSHFESEYILGRKIVFICTAKGNPRPHVTWYKNGIEIYAHTFLQIHEWIQGTKKNIIKSKMEIDPATQMDAGYYECQADNKYSVDYKSFRTDYAIEFD